MTHIKHLICIVFLISLYTHSQDNTDKQTDGLSLNSGTIDNQFEYVIQRSNNYQDYKVIKKAWLHSLKAHTLDSLNAAHKALTKTQAVVDTQTKEIANLKLKLSETEDTLANTNKEKDSMSLFGLQLSKISYNIMLWSIIGVLLALLLLFVYKFNNSNSVTRKAKKTLSEVEEEFEEHRKRALEREQKVRRQLQDEINKQRK